MRKRMIQLYDLSVLPIGKDQNRIAGTKFNNPTQGWGVRFRGDLVSPVFQRLWEAKAWAREHFVVAGWDDSSYRKYLAIPGVESPKKVVESSTRKELFRAILEQPEDDTVRLAYADLMDEEDEPERAEFIRLDIRISKMVGHYQEDGGIEYGALGTRNKTLLNEYGYEWSHELIKCFPETHSGFHFDQFGARADYGLPRWTWSRGFQDNLSPGVWSWFKAACYLGLFKYSPITTVNLFGPDQVDYGTSRAWTFVCSFINAYRFNNINDSLLPFCGPRDEAASRYLGDTAFTFSHSQSNVALKWISTVLTNYGRDKVGLPLLPLPERV